VRAGAINRYEPYWSAEVAVTGHCALAAIPQVQCGRHRGPPPANVLACLLADLTVVPGLAWTGVILMAPLSLSRGKSSVGATAQLQRRL